MVIIVLSCLTIKDIQLKVSFNKYYVSNIYIINKSLTLYKIQIIYLIADDYTIIYKSNYS